jgi:uncharacterized protein
MLKQALITAESLILAFFLAVSKGDFEGCQSLIQQGAYVDARDENGNSSLNQIVSSPKRVKFSRMLLKAGAAVNGTNVLGETPLFAASRTGNVSCVKLLIKQGADPNVRNRKGVTALMQAAEEGHVDVVKVLADAGTDVNVADNRGETALMIGAALGHTDIVSALITAGADRSMTAPYGWTAVMHATAFGQTEIANMLKVASTLEEEAGAVLAIPPLGEEPLVA